MISLVLLLALGGASAQPPIPQKAAYARWMVQNMTWGVMSTTSTLPGVLGTAFGNPVSFADSGDGTPVFCVTALDQSIKDLAVDPRMSLTVSEADSKTAACSSVLGGDAENPPCARLVLSGSFAKVTDDDEWASAARALNASHPAMDSWGCFGGDVNTHGHDFFLAKMRPTQVWLINMYGGAAVMTASEYYSQKM